MREFHFHLANFWVDSNCGVVYSIASDFIRGTYCTMAGDLYMFVILILLVC